MQVYTTLSFKWTQQITVACAGTVTVCGFSVGAQENWLITQHIHTVLPGGGGERLRKVTVQFEGTLNGCDISRQCRQSFDVYKWQTSTINRTAAANTTSYVPVGRISPSFNDGHMSFITTQDIQLNADEDGFYLAVVDLSTCITLTRIFIFYTVCPGNTRELIIKPEAVDSESIEGTPSVVGECAENSSPEPGAADPLLVCGAGGQWQVIVPCLCNPGYQLDISQNRCTGDYSHS